MDQIINSFLDIVMCLHHLCPGLTNHLSHFPQSQQLVGGLYVQEPNLGQWDAVLELLSQCWEEEI